MNARDEPQRTPDGHHIVIDGRKWRATDPSLPEDVAARLRHHLMAARRAVRAATTADDASAERSARARVRHAKIALGERGTPWWEQSPDQRRRRWEEHLAKLDADAPDQQDG
ncbi:hypothetical protein J8N05_42935 [Streptomyces sp. BH-SS-21]|uniref:Biopolymer transporter Tol n=1 Tax=Streptomyces liliiviolaceus TaxID=2823109 RepID=A0A941BCN3_9ACTN|nr:hypothetical protein [Streptomyces liliiviolaceus]MBQ0854922.1 hypothetical protein [Streptomyces liliiviolaceus]